MLKSWSIKNFKPIVDSGELQFAPVTVLAGRNSSGKSSLLQSVLMIAQTLGNRLLDRPLLPNERLVQLGTFEDILSELTQSRTLELQFSLEMKDGNVRPTTRLRRISGWDVVSAYFFAKFNSATSNGTSSSAIEASKVAVEHVQVDIDLLYQNQSNNKEMSKISFDLQKINNEDMQHFLENVLPEQQSLTLSTEKSNYYLGQFKHTDKTFLLGSTEDQYLVTLSHFFPSKFTKKYNISERRKDVIPFMVHNFLETGDKFFFDIELGKSGPRRTAAQVVKSLSPQSPVSQKLKEAINALVDKYNANKKFTGEVLEDLALWIREIIKGGMIDQEKKELMERIEDITVQEYLDPENEEENLEGLESGINDISIENIENVIEQTASFFTSKIRYLGPLRADPQTSQKFGPSSELDDVGSKGEFAAAVYDANYAARIVCYNPQLKRLERATLKEALDCWAQYLGVAQRVTTEMAGFSGVSWKIIPKEGRKARSLPEVGVGISQILPILVMGLLSPTDCLLIIEQPELHLHPYVQARLGDFFMGLAKCKKQCLIETHSENLVSQLRLHIVQAGGLEKSDCMVYFVDQDEQGAAKFEKIEISPNGNILNWPDGFFDETMLQEDRITAASLRKRAQEAKHDS